MRQDVCMFFFVISLSVFVSNLEELFFFSLFKLFGFYVHILGRLFALSFLLFMTLSTTFYRFWHESFSSFFVAPKPFFVLNHSQNAVLSLKDSGDK